MNTPDLRLLCVSHLKDSRNRIPSLRGFLGLDGFVDEIIHVVDKRQSAESFVRIGTISQFAERVAGAAGKSTNFELVNAQTKLGGNGPILANALATFGVQIAYLGALGYPHLHPVFEGFSRQAEVHSIAEPGHTDALEFDDGKLLLGKSIQLQDVNWNNIRARFGADQFAEKFAAADLVGFVNWTMIPHMSAIWEAIQREIPQPPPNGSQRRLLFFDLADPEKRHFNDIASALELIVRFQERQDVILGLNEKEAHELSKVMGLHHKPRNQDGLAALARELLDRLNVHTVVIHPVRYALACTEGRVHFVEGPYVEKPAITTGAGDHFNAGFCLGRLLGLENTLSLLCGVATSGYYVRTAKSPTLDDLIAMIEHWPDQPESAGA